MVAVLASYGFTRYRGRIKEIIFFIYIILMLMPYQVTLVPNYLVSNWLHLLDTRWAIWLPGIFSPFAVYLLTKFMRRIPISVIEAAQIDGAGEWQIFRRICLPLCKGCLCSVAILVFIDYWNMVEQPLILLSDDTMHPLSVFLSKIKNGEIGLAFAVATIYMIPTLLVFLYGKIIWWKELLIRAELRDRRKENERKYKSGKKKGMGEECGDHFLSIMLVLTFFPIRL